MIEQIECQNCGTLNAAGSHNCTVCRGPLTPEAIEALDDQSDTIAEEADNERFPRNAIGARRVLYSPTTQVSAKDEMGLEAGEWLRTAPRPLLASLALMIVGLFGGVLFHSGFFMFLFWVGIMLLIAWAALHYPRILGKEQVVDRWNVMISNADGKGKYIIQDTEAFLAKTRSPDVEMERQAVSSGLIRGILGGKRSFLIISNIANSNLKPYKMYINARDYGTTLQVSWYLVHQPSLSEKFMILLLCVPVVGILFLPIYLLTRLTVSKQSGLLGLDVFDEQDLRAYVTNAHHCLLEAVDKLMLDLGQDPSKIERKSRGFLGIT